MVLEGECNCGAIKVILIDAVENSQPVACACLNCRKQSGGLGTYITTVADGDVTVVGTPKAFEDRKTDSGTMMHRWFCGDCGSPIYSSTVLVPGKKFIKMGLFGKILKPAAEMYCKNKGEWEPVVEGTVQLQAGP